MELEKRSELVDRIQTQLLDVNYYTDIEFNLNSRRRWSLVSDVTECISNVLACMAIILAFAEGFFHIEMLSFASGCVGVASMALLRFSAYALNESRERLHKVNTILTSLKMEKIPDNSSTVTGLLRIIKPDAQPDTSTTTSSTTSSSTNRTEPDINV